MIDALFYIIRRVRWRVSVAKRRRIARQCADAAHMETIRLKAYSMVAWLDEGKPISDATHSRIRFWTRASYRYMRVSQGQSPFRAKIQHRSTPMGYNNP